MGKSKQLATMLSDAPAALDTLDELAAALGDDANFATTVTNSIATKAPLADPQFTGNVGIGANTPVDSSGFGKALDVNGTNGAALYLRDNTDSKMGVFGQWDGELSIHSKQADGTIGFYINNGYKAKIDSSGNLGIGETSPENILHIKTSASGGPQIELDSTNGTANSAFINFDGTSLQLATQRDMVDGSKRDTAKSWGGINIVGVAAGSYIQLQTSEGNNNAVSTRMTITKEGDVGIGATNPGGSRLYLQDTHTTTVTNATQLISNTTLTINGNSSQGSDVMRMGPMGTSGRYFIDVSNSAGSAAYDLLLNPTGGGKVGINQTSANFNLDVNGGMRVMNAGNDSYGQLYIQATGTGDAQIAFVTTANGRSIYVDQNDSNKMRFSTGWGKGVAYKEMVIDNDANLICGGGTKEGRGITLYGSGGNGFYSVTTGTSFYCITNHQLTSSTGTISTFYNNSTYCGGITITGTNQTLFQSGSDYRLKENIVDMADGATAILKKLRPRTFNFKSEPGNTIDGFIAHEVEGIVDNAVSGIKDEVYDEAGAEDNPNVDVGDPKYQGIDPGKMVPLLVKTIQELEARITQLESA